MVAKRTGKAKAGWRFLGLSAGAILSAFLVGTTPFEARAVTPDELFQKVFPKVEQPSGRKPARRKPHRATPVALPSKGLTTVREPRAAVPAVNAPLPLRRPSVNGDPAVSADAPQVEAADATASPLPRKKPAEDRSVAGLIAIRMPAEATVGTVRTVPVQPATARGGPVAADPPGEGQLAFAPPVLPTPLTPPAAGPAEAPAQQEALMPAPQDGASPADGPPVPRQKPEIVLAAMTPRIVPALPELAACKASMSGLKISASALPAIHAGSCGGPDPFDVTALESGKVDLEPAARINCEVATTLARWMEEDIQPSAVATLGGRVTGLRVADSYSCRGRNQIATAPLSEHSFLNAIDIAAFEVNGRWVTVAKAGDRTEKEDAFLRDARVSACGKFNTVLGPGSDAYHEDHYHLDQRHRGKGGDTKYCH